MGSNAFWLFDWLDEFGVKNIEQAEKALQLGSTTDDLNYRATAWKKSQPPPATQLISIVAGRGIDFSSHLDCDHPECRKLQVDNLLKKTWHYFDKIIVDDAISHEISHHWDSPLSDRIKWILPDIEAVLYLREIGAENLVEFREKNLPCQLHLERHATEAGMGWIIDEREALVRWMADGGSVKLKVQEDGLIHWMFNHPSFEHTQWGTLNSDYASDTAESTISQAIYSKIFDSYVANLSSDTAMARKLGAPLGTVIEVHKRILAAHSADDNPANIAFELNLPVLTNVPVETLVRLRGDEHESFQRFQDSLRLAIKERLSAGELSDPKKIADEIRQDLIEPGLRQIRSRLNAARNVAAKQFATAAVVGILATTIGLLAGPVAAPIVSAGISTALGVDAINTGIKERSDIALSDLFFLWKAVRKSHKSI